MVRLLFFAVVICGDGSYCVYTGQVFSSGHYDSV